MTGFSSGGLRPWFAPKTLLELELQATTWTLVAEYLEHGRHAQPESHGQTGFAWPGEGSRFGTRHLSDEPAVEALRLYLD